ncbi:MAG: NADP-dependent malic enzyme [Deltaproteobacteria bacterium]|nr:MAG: NADP-dependent malic enzyme [Deltaproteobacteria bacterium]
MSERDNALSYHSGDRPGKLQVVPTKPLSTQRDLSLAYSPGVAWPCRAIHDDPELVYSYTAKGNLVAVVTNGTAVLGLGDIGPEAGKPVMEGKANLFKKFADIDVFDIELNARTADEMVAAVKAIAPTFGGINLEDIKAPECFEVERRLQEELDIPVFHDDQHGTAIISAAALINACELTGRELSDLRIVFTGAGAAALACAELYVTLGVKRDNIRMFDAEGLVHRDRDDLFPSKAAFAIDNDGKSIQESLDGADAFIGLSVGNLLTADMIRGMAPSPIIFAMANPDPEIPFEVAREARPDCIMATGRSDFPNQVNNVLGFPFVFRGALDTRARKITAEMKAAATRALAALARQDVPDRVLRAYGLSHLQFGRDYIIPKPFDPRVLTWVAPAVAKAAEDSGVARTPIRDLDAYREQLHEFVERARGLMQPLIQRARNAATPVRVALPDGTDPQVLRAAQVLVEERICIPVLLGPEYRIAAKAEQAGVSLDGMQIEPCEGSEHFDRLARELFELRARKGFTYSSARVKLRDRTWFGAMMVRDGLVEAMVGGVHRPYHQTLSPALKVLGTKPGVQRVSGVYAMLFKDRKIFFGDCTVNVDPDAAGLAEIALNAARVAESFGVTPRVAMLSFSDFGEHHRAPAVALVREAIARVREAWPELEIDGEMQADTAVDFRKLTSDFPFSHLTGPANVLVFPDLQSGNIAYKLLVHLAAAEALGPLLAGLGAPASVIPVGADVADIVNITTWTVVQALERRRTSD